MLLGLGGGGGLHMLRYRDVPLFWVLSGLFQDFLVFFGGASGFLCTKNCNYKIIKT